jgi:uncharacterized caspase-like protein
MGRIVQFGLAVLLTLVSFAGAASAQSRNALVIGNSAYVSAPKLKTPDTDAAIVAETLRAAGYDVTELHDVKQATIGQSLRDFLDKVAASGPDGAAIVYYSGHGAQSDGANYLVPVDAVINNDADVVNEAFRLDDLLDELAKIPLAARIVVLDASRDHKFGAGGDKPVPKGLAMGDTVPGTLLAYAAAPGALADDGDGDFSLYTGALVTLMRQPGLDIEQIFKAVRLEVNKATNGAQTPWSASDLTANVRLFAATAAAPAQQTTLSGARIPPKEERTVTKEMLRGLSADEAYAVTVEEDTLETYQWFVELYPKHAFAPQIWDMIETRREAVLWQRALAQNTTRAYWNYLKRYPKGAHISEAQDRLAELSAPPAPPANYVVVPEALPPDYYDEAVDLYEVYPEGYDAPPSVFDLLAPLFLPRPPPRQYFDRGRNFIPNRIPLVSGDPVRTFTPRDRTTTRTVTGTDRTRDRTKTGIVRTNNRTSTGVRIDRASDLAKTTTKTKNQKPGLTIRPTGTPTTGRPTTGRPTTPGVTTTGRPTIPGATTGRPTIPGATTGRPTTGRPTIPPSGRPTIPGATTGRPATPGATPGVTTGRPTTPGTTPGATPGVTTTGRPTLPPRPGTPGATAVKPATPGATPTGRPTTTRPGLPPVPGTAPVRPATPTPGVTVTPGTPTTRPGLPAVPGATTVRPATPTPATPPAPGATTIRPGVPAVPGTTPVRPATPTPATPTLTPATPPGTTPATRPGVTRPGLPPVPGATPVRPATPPPPTPSVGQRPGLPPTTARPPAPPTATPSVTRPVAPPTATPPVTRPIAPPTATPPTVRPVTPPTVRPATPPTVRPTTPPATRPTPPTVRPATPPAARPTPPAARPTPPAARPTPPAARPTPPAARPTPPAARPLPPRPSPPPAARPAPPPRPAAPPPKPAAPPPPKQPVCTMVNGKKVCK